MGKIETIVQDWVGLNPNVQTRIFSSLIIVLLLWIARWVVLQFVWRKTEDVQTRYRWQKFTAYAAVFLGLLMVVRVWFAGIQSLATLLGLITAGLAIALQDLVKSMAGWAFVLWRRPFSVGDRIQVGNMKGDVIDIRLFKFTLMEIGNWVDAEQSTGRVIHLPNSLIISETIANYSRGFDFIWNEIAVLITFESNWKKAKELLQAIGGSHATQLSHQAEKRIREASKRYMIFYSALTPTVYVSVKDSGVLLTLRYLIDPRKRRGSEHAIWEDVLETFAQHDDIDFAYPTQRFFNNVLEGKKGARATPGGAH